MEVVATLTSDGDDPVQQLCILSDGRAVTGRRLTVTTIGVPLRAELRLKSLLTVMRSRTLDEWSFTEEGPVDLAICDPASALTRLAVKRAATDGPRRVVSLICGEQAPHVIPATRQVFLAQPLDDAVLARLMAPVLSVDVRQLHETHAAELIAAGTEAHSADVLLWKLGLRVPHDQLHPDLPADGLFSLRRWPDFGRLPHRSEPADAQFTRLDDGRAALLAWARFHNDDARPTVQRCIALAGDGTGRYRLCNASGAPAQPMVDCGADAVSTRRSCGRCPAILRGRCARSRWRSCNAKAYLVEAPRWGH